MDASSYQFLVGLSREDGTELGQTPVDIDWAPAIESVHFDAIRTGKLPAVTSCAGAARIVPIWHATTGRPYLSGVRVFIKSHDGGEPISGEVTIDYFRAAARKLAERFIEAGQLHASERYLYVPAAFARRGHAAPSNPNESDVEDIPQPLCLTDRPMQQLLDCSRLRGKAAPNDLPVFIPRAILDSIEEQVRAANDLETGGILLGRLFRDTARPHIIFHEITAHVPATGALSEPQKLTFTPQTWAAAQAALDLRKTGEMMSGWFHSHPDWCRRCDPARRARCSLNRVFFSSTDSEMHRCIFPKAYHIALLMSDRGGAIVPSLFVWSGGVVASAGMHVLDDGTDAVAESTDGFPVTMEGIEHAAH